MPPVLKHRWSTGNNYLAGITLDQRGPRWPLAIGALISAIEFSTLLWPGFIEHPLAITATTLCLCAVPFALSFSPPTRPT